MPSIRFGIAAAQWRFQDTMQYRQTMHREVCGNIRLCFVCLRNWMTGQNKTVVEDQYFEGYAETVRLLDFRLGSNFNNCYKQRCTTSCSTPCTARGGHARCCTNCRSASCTICQRHTKHRSTHRSKHCTDFWQCYALRQLSFYLLYHLSTLRQATFHTPFQAPY